MSAHWSVCLSVCLSSFQLIFTCWFEHWQSLFLNYDFVCPFFFVLSLIVCLLIKMNYLYTFCLQTWAVWLLQYFTHLNKLTVNFCIISLVICLSVSLCYKFVCLLVDQKTLFSRLIFALLNWAPVLLSYFALLSKLTVINKVYSLIKIVVCLFICLSVCL